jgi:hypothetical protein
MTLYYAGLSKFGHSAVADDVPYGFRGGVNASKSRSLSAWPIGVDADVIACRRVSVCIGGRHLVLVQVLPSLLPNCVLKSLEFFLTLRCARAGVTAGTCQLDGLIFRVNQSQWVITNIGVLIEALGIGQHLSLEEHWIGRHEAAEGGGVVAGAEVVEAGFGVAFFGGEFVVLGAGVGDGAFATEGIEVRIVARRAGSSGDDASGAEMVGKVVVDGVGEVAACDALAAEENIFVEAGVVSVARKVGLVEGITAHAVPVELATGFLDTFAVTVIGVFSSSPRLVRGAILARCPSPTISLRRSSER